jgi:hypothetical protein
MSLERPKSLRIIQDRNHRRPAVSIIEARKTCLVGFTSDQRTRWRVISPS